MGEGIANGGGGGSTPRVLRQRDIRVERGWRLLNTTGVEAEGICTLGSNGCGFVVAAQDAVVEAFFVPLF